MIALTIIRGREIYQVEIHIDIVVRKQCETMETEPPNPKENRVQINYLAACGDFTAERGGCWSAAGLERGAADCERVSSYQGSQCGANQ
jgi:hypothetical protein